MNFADSNRLKLMPNPRDAVRIFVRFVDGSEIETADGDPPMLLRLMHAGAFRWKVERYGPQTFLILAEQAGPSTDFGDRQN